MYCYWDYAILIIFKLALPNVTVQPLVSRAAPSTTPVSACLVLSSPNNLISMFSSHPFLTSSPYTPPQKSPEDLLSSVLPCSSKPASDLFLLEVETQLLQTPEFIKCTSAPHTQLLHGLGEGG